MSSHHRNMINPLPISLPPGAKSDVRTQFAALCYRVHKEKLQILLITSRTTKRWILPKGWPMDGKTPAQSAAVEAWEEAGVQGLPDEQCLGVFSYSKASEDGGTLPCLAMVFAVAVQSMARDFPEAAERERMWVSRKRAAKLVDEPELSRILRDFEPGLPA